MKNKIHNLIVPKLGVNDDELLISKQNYFSGNQVNKGDIIAEFESTKEVTSFEAFESGYIYYLYEEFTQLDVGSVFALISDSEINKDEINNHLNKIQNNDNDFSENKDDIKLTQKAQDLVEKNNIDKNILPKGKLLREKDILNIVQNLKGTNIVSTIQPTNLLRIKNERVIIIGAGKGSEVVIDLLKEDMKKTIVGLVDDNPKAKVRGFYPLLECNINNFPDVIDRADYDSVIISIGSDKKSMNLRDEIYKNYKSKGIKFCNVISKNALIKNEVSMGEGNLIGDNVYIGAFTVIGNNNSISYNAIIGHHNIIGDSNLIAPGVNTSGSVNIGNNCIIPAGVNFMNRVSVGNDVVLPLGYNVINNIKNGEIIKQKIDN